MTGSQIRTELSKIIDQLVQDNNPQAIDDDLPDIMADCDERDEAIDSLIKLIENYREDL
jgi:hypothetical protein